MENKNYYIEMTKLIYQDLAWGPIYKKNDGAYIKDTDNKSEISDGPFISGLFADLFGDFGPKSS